MTSNSIIVLNEIFNSTSLNDQIFLSAKVLEQILDVDAIGVCVTFIDGLSTLSEKTVSMVSTVDPEILLAGLLRSFASPPTVSPMRSRSRGREA